jgi:hypothetical protein
MWPFLTVTNLTEGAEALRIHSYGVIEVKEGKLQRVMLRPWPKIISIAGVGGMGRWQHWRRKGDSIRIFYNQPRRCPNFLVLKYAESARNTTMSSLVRALAVLDEIARLKRSDALLCDVYNDRITTKLLNRWGWEPHCPSRFHRHFIKRFYGKY